MPTETTRPIADDSLPDATLHLAFDLAKQSGECHAARVGGGARVELVWSSCGARVGLAWGWLRWQPTSALSEWYRRRYATGGARLRRIGIVALARRLLIALWRYVEQDQVPTGATLKA